MSAIEGRKLKISVYVLCVVCVGAYFIYGDNDASASFFLDFDPGANLLSVKYAGGRSGVVHAYTLYEDGRLVRQITSYDGEKVYSSGETRLSRDQVSLLISEIVDSSLMESSTDSIKQRMGIGESRIYTSPDSSTMYLKIILKHYKSPGSAEFEPSSSSLVIENPIGSARLFPHVKEIQCLANIARELKNREPELRDR